MSTSDYGIEVESFAERHYIASFRKKYKGKQWETTWLAIRAMLCRFDNLISNNQSNSSKLDIIGQCNGYLIVKLDFTVAGSGVSAKSSGNRIVAAVDKTKRWIKILLVYSKNDVGPPNETVKWKKIVSENIKEFDSLK